MAKYLTNKATQAALEKIITQAEKKLVLISPYIKLTNTWLARIKAIGEKGISIKIIYRKDKLDRTELERLKVVKNIELKYTDDLHAKCYFNEKEMIITSLNLLESSEKNWEMGILINREKDKEIYDDTIADVVTIFQDAIPTISTETRPNLYRQETSKQPTQKKAKATSLPTKGHCISCGDSVKFNVEKPLCRDCWEDFDEFYDEGEHCFCCGKEEETEFYKPLCYPCYKEYEHLLPI